MMGENVCSKGCDFTLSEIKAIAKAVQHTFELGKGPCEDCDASGKVFCSRCNGAGLCDCKKKCDAPCKGCNGSGKVACKYCGGTGEVTWEQIFDYPDYGGLPVEIYMKLSSDSVDGLQALEPGGKPITAREAHYAIHAYDYCVACQRNVLDMTDRMVKVFNQGHEFCGVCEGSKEYMSRDRIRDGHP